MSSSAAPAAKKARVDADAKVPNIDDYCCSVCLEIMTNPSTLPCGHTNCCECLQQIARSGGDDAAKLLCPVCARSHKRSRFESPSASVALRTAIQVLFPDEYRVREAETVAQQVQATEAEGHLLIRLYRHLLVRFLQSKHMCAPYNVALEWAINANVPSIYGGDGGSVDLAKRRIATLFERQRLSSTAYWVRRSGNTHSNAELVYPMEHHFDVLLCAYKGVGQLIDVNNNNIRRSDMIFRESVLATAVRDFMNSKDPRQKDCALTLLTQLTDEYAALKPLTLVQRFPMHRLNASQFTNPTDDNIVANAIAIISNRAEAPDAPQVSSSSSSSSAMQ